MNEFNSKARDWDKSQMHIERSQVIAGEILKAVSINKKMKALEYGAGTGLLSFILKDKFEEITLMDSSSEMINVAREKIISEGVKNFKTILIDLEKGSYKAKFDIIYTQMVLHHVISVEALLTKFYSLLNPGGYLSIADLYSGGSTFHGEGFSGHNGFDPEKLSSLLINIGYRTIEHHQCFIIKKNNETGSVKEYPVFLLTAKK